MKSGEFRETGEGVKKLSFRQKKVMKSDGPFGIPQEDWFYIISFFTVFYGCMTGFFSLLYLWNAVRLAVNKVHVMSSRPSRHARLIFIPLHLILSLHPLDKIRTRQTSPRFSCSWGHSSWSFLESCTCPSSSTSNPRHVRMRRRWRLKMTCEWIPGSFTSSS